MNYVVMELAQSLQELWLSILAIEEVIL